MQSPGSGFWPKPDPHPCIKVKHVDTLKAATNAIHIAFDSEVELVSHSIAYGPGDLLVEIGSAMGLWTGLSALGVFELFLASLIGIKRKIAVMRKNKNSEAK